MQKMEKKKRGEKSEEKSEDAAAGIAVVVGTWRRVL